MHDLLDGVVPFDMVLAIRKFVEKDNPYFTVEDLNNIIIQWCSKVWNHLQKFSIFRRCAFLNR
jgi:hypothetical protein